MMTSPGMIGEPGAEERVMTALFTDVASFSTFSECLTASELARFLNAYLTAMCDIVEAHGGTIDKFEGDAIVAFFGAPIWYQDHAARACMACIDQQHRLSELRQRWKADRTLPRRLQELVFRWEAQGKTFLKVRMGLCAGPVVVGNMGTTRHPNYTVMGDVVNLAARFEAEQKMYGTSIMINDRAYDQVKDLVETRRLDLIQVVGSEEPVTAYEVLDRKGALSPEKYQVLELYNQGLAAYEAYEFLAAGKLFHQALEIDPQDGPSALYVERCKECSRNPPADLIFRGRGKDIVISEVDWAQEQQERLEAQLQLIQELEKELQTAHDLQMRLMPKSPPHVPGLDIAGQCLPANHVGGDFFQYFQQDGILSLCLADVTGHAMEAAVPGLMFSGVLKSQMELCEPLDLLFQRLNRTLHTFLDAHTFVCFTMGQYDLATGVLGLADAGCPYPYHYREATGTIEELRVEAYPLGVRAEGGYPVIQTILDPGDRVVFCSDGVVEATNAAGEMFGFERTAEVVRRGCVEDLSAEALLQRVIAEVKIFSQGVPQGDDQTVVVLKVER